MRLRELNTHPVCVSRRAVLLAALALVIIPAFAHAQDYVSPSVMRIEQPATGNSSIEFQNYSYIDKPFDNVTSNVSIGSYLSGKTVVHEITINISNTADKYITFGAKLSYCRIGTNDCQFLTCDYYSSYLAIKPQGYALRKCTVTSDSCAGREIRVEYSMQGISGSVVTKKTARCPQSFCDQVTMSISSPSIVHVGDKIMAEGYLSEIGKEGVPSPIIVTAGAYTVKTGSNDFGYWSAPVEIKKSGDYELSAKSESCNRESKTTIQVFEAKETVAKPGIVIYPTNIDVELGGNALLAVQQNSDENVFVSLTGVPQSWIEPSSFVISRGTKFVYLSPKSTGSYTITMRSGSEEKNASLFVAKKEQTETNKQNNAATLLILVIALIFLLNSKKPSREGSERNEYLDIVKKEIENKGNRQVSVHQEI